MEVAPLKILAIDNEQLLLWALERAFTGRQLQICTAPTTEQALAAIERSRFDLFLLDFELNDPASQSMLQTIDKRCPYVPIIIMTTCDLASPELNREIRSLRKRGAWHLLEKPFRLDRLLHFVDLIFSEADHAPLNELAHNYDSEKRHHLRRPHVQAIDLRIKQIIDGENREVTTLGILTDISECGVGLLSHEPLQRDQIVAFGSELQAQCGIVAWCNMIEKNTCRAGIHLC